MNINRRSECGAAAARLAETIRSLYDQSSAIADGCDVKINGKTVATTMIFFAGSIARICLPKVIGADGRILAPEWRCKASRDHSFRNAADRVAERLYLQGTVDSLMSQVEELSKINPRATVSITDGLPTLTFSLLSWESARHILEVTK